MPRPDGRIEPGQPLRGAISARAWNRAQDAADLVLGAGTGITAPQGIPHTSRLVVPVRVYGACPPASAVFLTGAFPARRLGDQPSSGSLTAPYSGGYDVTHLSGILANLGNSSGYPLGITIDGSGEQDFLGSSVIPCVIRGLAVVRVRLFSESHRFAVFPFAKGNESAGSRYSGILDSSPCACDGSVKVVAYDVPSPPSNVTPGNAPIAWATVIV